MVGLFEHLRARYGTITEYAARIGVSDALVAQLRAGLLEPDLP
jgi:predicted transcriptional regulator